MHRLALRLLACLLIVACGALSALAQADYGADAQDEPDFSDTGNLLDIGRALWRAGNVDKAEQMFTGAFDRSRVPADKVMAAEVLSDFFDKQSESERSIAIFDRLVLNRAVMADSMLAARTLFGLGHAYLKTNQNIKAIKCFRRSQSFFNPSADSTFASALYNNMAQTIMQDGDITIALALADSSRDFAVKGSMAYADAVLTSANVCASMGRHRRAFEDMSLALHLKEINWSTSGGAQQMDETVASAAQRADSRAAQEVAEVRAELASARADSSMAHTVMLGIGLIACVAIVAYIVTVRSKNAVQSERLAVQHELSEHERVVNVVVNEAYSQIEALIGYANQQMERLRRLPPEDMGVGRDIYTMAYKLNCTICNLLAWCQTRHQLHACMDTVTLVDRLAPTIEACELIALEKKIVLSKDIRSGARALVDPNHLDIIVFNLVFNAIKYSPEGGRVSVVAFAHNGKAHIMVEDNGLGMDSQIATDFNHGNEMIVGTPAVSHDETVDVGLSICRDLVHANSGEIVVDSVQGKGTTINVVLQSD